MLHVDSYAFAQKLSGPLDDFKDLTALRTIWLPYNMLTGTLPAAWTQLQALSDIDLSGNQLAGPLPDLWGQIAVGMRSIKLNMNNFQASARAWLAGVPTSHQPQGQGLDT
jgi:hypothetical protein